MISFAERHTEMVSYISMPLIYYEIEKKAQETIIHDLVNSEDGNKHILAIAFYPDTKNYDI